MKQSNTAKFFSHIYENQLWGKTLAKTPFSGPGSYDAELVDPYVLAARFFIANTFSMPPNVIDLGCGDFNVGRQIRNVTDRYIACDIVANVVDYNRLIYASENVDFRMLDLVTQEPPAGDIVFIRQILQHLRNDQISRFLAKLRKYKWAIITEHIPFEDPFVSNQDIEAGVYTRYEINSGAEFIQTPFDLIYHNRTILCGLVDDGVPALEDRRKAWEKSAG